MLIKIIYYLKNKVFHKNFLDTTKITSSINKINPIFLDIGSYDGGEIADFFSKRPDAKVFAFEIDPRAINLFKKKWNKKIINKKITLIEKAISNTDGITEFYSSLNRYDHKYEYGIKWSMSGSINKPKLHKERWNITFDKPRKVNSITLDTWYKQNLNGEKIDLIYADVNGGEKELIEGGYTTLTRNTKYFYTEFFDEEMYEGQVNKKWILKTLNNFSLISIHDDNNMLLKNNLLIK